MTRPARFGIAVCTCALLTVLLAGCGGDTGEDYASTSRTAEAAEPAKVSAKGGK